MLSAEVLGGHARGVRIFGRCCRGLCNAFQPRFFVRYFPALLSIVECLGAFLPVSWLHSRQILVKKRLCLEFSCPWLPPTPLQQATRRLLRATHRCWAWPHRADQPLVDLCIFHRNWQPSCPKQSRPRSSRILLLRRHNRCRLVPPFQSLQLHLPLLGAFPLHWAAWLLRVWTLALGSKYVPQPHKVEIWGSLKSNFVEAIAKKNLI